MRALAVLAVLALLPSSQAADEVSVSDFILDQSAFLELAQPPLGVGSDACHDPLTDARTVSAARSTDAVDVTIDVLADLPATCGEGAHTWTRSYRVSLAAKVGGTWHVLDGILLVRDGASTECVAFTKVGVPGYALECVPTNLQTGTTRAWSIPLAGTVDGVAFDLRDHPLAASAYTGARATSPVPGVADVVYTDAVPSFSL